LNQIKNIVIIGCGAGGGTAAQFARKTDRKCSITIFEKGNYPQYSKCGLPYAISGEIQKLSDLIEFDEEWFKKANINLELNTTVEKIDINKKLIIAKKQNNVLEKPYDSLIICTGATPFIPNIKSIDTKGVFVLRTIDDAKKISAYIFKVKNVVIVGAGLVGLEIADNLRKKGMNITIIEALPRILTNNLDDDMTKIVQEHIPKDIKILTNHLITRVISNKEKIKKVVIKDKRSGEEKEIDTDLLIVGAGNQPNIQIAKNIGCKIGTTGGIVVNNKCETSVKNIYAVGDCTEYIDFVTAKPALVGLGSIAVRQGIAAGTNAAGSNYELPKGFLNTSFR